VPAQEVLSSDVKLGHPPSAVAAIDHAWAHEPRPAAPEVARRPDERNFVPDLSPFLGPVAPVTVVEHEAAVFYLEAHGSECLVSPRPALAAPGAGLQEPLAVQAVHVQVVVALNGVFRAVPVPRTSHIQVHSRLIPSGERAA
jgi:hypothetical protein